MRWYNTSGLDVTGQTCLCDDTPEGAGNRFPAPLVLDTVLYSHATGHAYTIDPQKHALARLSPAEAAKLAWCEKEHPRAEPNIFAGEPPVEPPVG